MGGVKLLPLQTTGRTPWRKGFAEGCIERISERFGADLQRVTDVAGHVAGARRREVAKPRELAPRMPDASAPVWDFPYPPDAGALVGLMPLLRDAVPA